MSANQGKKLNTYQEVTTLETGSNIIINQLVNGVLKVKQLTKVGFVAIINALITASRVEEITYANLVIKANAGLLEVGKEYKITNATAANFNLIVQAVTVNQIGCDAKDPLYPNDVVKYNFASNVITWRWDTVRDVSAGQDWRNSNSISIANSATKIEIGNDCDTIIIQSDCTNIKIGNNCSVITIFAECTSIEILNFCSNIILSEYAVYKKICGPIDSYNFSTATNFYNITSYSEVRQTQSGSCRMNYYDSLDNFISVAP